MAGIMHCRGERRRATGPQAVARQGEGLQRVVHGKRLPGDDAHLRATAIVRKIERAQRVVHRKALRAEPGRHSREAYGVRGAACLISTG